MVNLTLNLTLGHLTDVKQAEKAANCHATVGKKFLVKLVLKS